MRITIIAVFFASPAIAWAVDFRGVELGQTCRHAAQVETTLGTRPRQDIDAMVQNNIVVFEDGSIAGQHAQFLYSCMQRPGIISQYSINISTRSESRAWELYAAAKAAAVSRLGVPATDSMAPDAVARLRKSRLAGLTWTYAFATWNSIEHQSVVLTIEKPAEDGDWSIDTIVSSNAGESPNKSLERTRER